MRAFQVTADEDDEYVSWGSDFDESCSDDGTDGRNSRTNDDCDNNDDEVDGEEDDDDDNGRLTGRCGSYSLSETERSSCQLRSIKCASTFDNTYEAISETPSTSSYCGSSENSSTFYETPPERRRGSCPSEKSSSGIGEMNGSTRSNSGDDRSELSEHCSVYDYSSNEKKRISQHPHQLSIEVTSEYIMRELNRKKRSFLNGCEASSEASSGQCSEPSPKARIRPLVKPAIPPKPNLTQFNPSKPGSPGTRRKVRRKIVRPTGEPPPPPVPKSPPPISPASSKLSLTDRLAELILDDLNEVLNVRLSCDPEDNDFASEIGDCVTSGSTVTLTASNIEKVTAAAAAEAAAAAATATVIETKSASASNNLTSSSSSSIVKSNCNNETSNLKNVSNQKDQSKQFIENHNLTKSDHLNQEKMGHKISKLYHHKHKSGSKQKKNTKGDNIHDKIFSSTATDVTCIVNDVDDEDFGDYETPLNFKYPMSHNLNNNVDSQNNTTASNSAHSGSSNCNRLVSRSSSVASGSYVPDSGFSDCTGISPYPISPPPPFDDNYCCSCRNLMKSVGSTPNLHAIRPSSRSDLSLSTVISTTPLSSSLSSSSSMKNQSNNVGASSNALTTTAPTFDNDSHNSSSSHHHHHHHYHHNHHHHHNNNNHHQHTHSHSTSNLSLITVDRPKLPRSKPDCNSNSNNNNNNNSNNSSTNGNHSNNSNNSSGISFKAEFAAKFAEKAAFAKKIINSRPPFKTFESIYATGKSFGFSSSSSSANNNSSSSVNQNNKINRSGSTCNLAQRPLPPLPDDVMPIEKYSWFHGLERDSATAVLKDLGTEGAYLIRPSKRAGQSNPLTLSILHEGKVFHLNVRRRSDGLYCLGKEKDKERTFESVPALIRFHQKEPILLTTKGESAGITKLMVTPISSTSISSST